MAQDSETRNVSDLEAEEIEAAAAHAPVPVDPNSPGSPAAPPGFAVDHTQLLSELAKMAEKMDIMQAELSKVKMENSKLKSIYTGDQKEDDAKGQPPEYFMTPQKETAAGLEATTPTPWNKN